MSKTWQERFDEEFCSRETSLWKFNISLNSYTSCGNEIKQFITDLRKEDMDELTKMLDNVDIYGSPLSDLEQLIKNYYTK